MREIASIGQSQASGNKWQGPRTLILGPAMYKRRASTWALAYLLGQISAFDGLRKHECLPSEHLDEQ